MIIPGKITSENLPRRKPVQNVFGKSFRFLGKLSPLLPDEVFFEMVFQLLEPSFLMTVNVTIPAGGRN